MQNSVIKKIKSLPPLDTTLIEINKLMKNKNRGFKQFADIIEKDPIITANILKLANSPYMDLAKK